MSAVLTVEQVRDAKIGPLRSAGQGWVTESRFLALLAGRFRTEVADATARSGWAGPAADAARTAMADDQRQLDAARQEAAALGAALTTAADEFEAAQRALAQALDDAARLGLNVSSDGGVSWPESLRNDPDTRSGDLQQRAVEVHARIHDALQRATTADQEAFRDITDDLGIHEDAFNPTAHEGRRRDPATILAAYQVMDDPHGTVKYPDPVTAFLTRTDRTTISMSEALMLNGLTIPAKFRFMKLTNHAYDVSDSKFSTVKTDDDKKGDNDSHRDAFRHAYWNALMTSHFGEDWASRYASAHEQMPGNPGDRESMDLYNNEVGRRIAVANPNASDEELERLVEEAVLRGDMVVIKKDGGALAYTDQVQDGETGKSDGRPFDGKGTDPGGVPSGLKS
ncbi:DUF6973 domain-containing protein [Kitasatospora sp. NPDC058170]|uniref:DUF6973 domain-containing protein n=1 Tax=Kitasatospora sp. NPDC058170 TaxID=3346364 RepID=UPI0036D8A018